AQRPTGCASGVESKLVVELDGVRHRRVAGEPEEPHDCFAPDALDLHHRLVVEAPGELNAQGGSMDPTESLTAALATAQSEHSDRLGSERHAQRLGEVGLRTLAAEERPSVQR